jgi:hypothetical protein
MGLLTNKIKNKRIELKKQRESEREESVPNTIYAWFKQLQIKRETHVSVQFNRINEQIENELKMNEGTN